MKQQQPDHENDEQVKSGDHQVGGELAGDDVKGPERHDGELFEGSALALPHDPEACDQGADEHEDQARQPRHHHPGRGEAGVVEDLHLYRGRVDPAREAGVLHAGKRCLGLLHSE